MIKALVERIIEAAKTEIEKYALDLLQRYPDDLLVHDKSAFELYAVAGARIGWMVGHGHSHLVPLGIHPGTNQEVKYLLNLANDDRFYEIVVSASGDDFTMKEITREGFAELARTRVPYKREGGVTGFWLLRDGSRVGSVMSEAIGNVCSPKYRATITPVAGITEADKAALEMWCQKSIVEAAGTLFVRSVVEVAPPIRLAHAA